MNRLRTGIIVVVAVVLLAMLLAACAPGAKPSEEKVITIGVISTFSGVGSEWGNYVLHPVQFWVEEKNEAGGIEAGGVTYKFRVVSGDDKFTASEGLTQARRLIYEEGASVLVVLNGICVTAIQDIVTQNKVLTLSHCGGYESSPDYPYTFAGYMIEALFPALYVGLRENFPDVKKLAGIQEEQAYAHSLSDAMAFYCEQDKAEGMEWLGSDYYEAGTSDYYPVLTKYRNLRAEVILNTSLVIEDLLAQARQGAEIGFYPYWDQTSYSMEELVAASSLEEMEALKFLATTTVGNTDRFREWALKYSERFGFEPGHIDPWASPIYENLLAYEQAIAVADSIDYEKISQVFQDPNFRTKDSLYEGGTRFMGEEVYGINACLSTPYTGEMVKDGKPVPLKSAEFAEIYYNYTVPWLNATAE